MIRAVKPEKMLVLILNSPQFVRKTNINDVLCKKSVAWQLCPVSTTARQIVRHEECLKKSPLQKFGASMLSKTWSKTQWGPRSNSQQVQNRQKRVTLFFNEITAPSLCRCFNISVQLFFFSTFNENLRNFWIQNYFFIKFGSLVSKYLLYKP